MKTKSLRCLLGFMITMTGQYADVVKKSKFLYCIWTRSLMKNKLHSIDDCIGFIDNNPVLASSCSSSIC